MCTSTNLWIQVHKLHFFRQKPRRTRVRVLGLSSKRKSCEEKVGKDVELIKNLKLYMENISILEENEKLRKKASLLHQENLALMSEFQRRFPK
ncbi:hypothetical protein BUALT_Bualt05G0067600 [Buddleja alternifolia]|uniref:Uncharacterized protein n=1 Tax=Buddleja alternifolia TaxID=168488 RepID=A0AAV6XIP6_9LAMI|nr:hypothetical protein BUALT_Bualt05G0067600 [Buddleja alternifolia]